MEYTDDIGSSKIGEIIRKAELDYRSGTTNISKYVQFDMLETLNKIDAYHYSKHISGSVDSLGREKPFPNIVVSAENIWYRATDIDRGQIKIRATKGKDTIGAFLANIHLQNWMKRENFGTFLNEWGRILARYGSAVVKFVEKDGKLHSMVVPWQTLIVDSVDFESNPVIEVLDLTEAQLRAREGYDQKIVDSLCDAKSKRKLLDGQDKDDKSDYIRIYEIHGVFPLSHITDDPKDEDTYVQQMHVMSFVASKKGGYDDYVLAKGKEEKSPYMLTHLIREEGRTLAVGPIEYLFDTQWMMSHTAKAIKDQLDIASKVIFQTSDGSFVGQNALAAVENGDILIHAPNSPLTQLQNNSHDITSLQNFANQWKVIGNEITGVSESMLGKAAVSGTAWRQVEALLNESHDLFKLMTQNKGLYIEEMMRMYVIPFKKKQMDTSEEISATLEGNDIDRIDAKFIKNKAIKLTNKALKEKMRSPRGVTTEDRDMLLEKNAQMIQAALSEQGDQRFFKPSEVSDMTWKEQFKDLEWYVEVDVTGENVDKDAMTTLNTLLMFIAKKQGQPMTPEEKFVFNKLLRQSGIVSEMELSSLKSAPQPIPQPLEAMPAEPTVPTASVGA